MNKVKPRVLPGFMELLPQDQILFNTMYDKIRKVYEKFGFLPLDTPTIEYSEVLLAKAGGETEKQIYSFNKGETDLSLRFDLTVPLARYVSQRYADITFPFKRYQMSKVFRGERPQKGRFREFYQCDIDVIGADNLDLIYDAEMPAVIYNVFKELNFGKFTIKINNRKILNGFFKYLELSNKVSDILRIIDKIDKIGKDTVKEELLKIDINVDNVDKILEFIAIDGSNEEIITKLKNIPIKAEMYLQGVDELEQVILNLAEFGVEAKYYKIDLTIARGLDYYTGSVYETVLDELPKLGSICSGGRYDNLTEYYTNQKLPGIGISIGLTRLFSQLKEQNIISSEKKSLTKVLVLPMENVNIKYALKVASMLRQKQINTDIYYTSKNLKQKIKYADKLGIEYVAIIGEEEENSKTVMIKNMINGKQEKVSCDIAEIIKKIK
ncbi:MAG: histidine--tRNA ligase [Clostridia bacterium]